MNELRPYRYGDEDRFEPIEETLSWHPDYKLEWNRILQPSNTWTGWINGKVAGVGGFIESEDRAYVWVLISTDIAKCKKSAYRLLRLGFQYVQTKTSCPLWTYVESQFAEGCRLIERFGFQKKKLIAVPGGLNLWLYEKV